MKVAVYPGSFDPVTNGHLDVFERSSRIFDQVIILTMINKNKEYTFSLNQRIDMIKSTISHIDNIIVDSYDGLLVDYMKFNNINIIVKGIRTAIDFEYEQNMNLVNKTLYPDIETVFLTSSPKTQQISSNAVKEIAKFGGDISYFVPKVVNNFIKYGLLDKE